MTVDKTTAIEDQFPIVEVSQTAEQESWRKEINRPLYHIHKWWATRLGSVFRAITLASLSPSKTQFWQDFYKYHQFTDKVVLDPFMGSGTTLGEAVKLGAKAIGCDINPVSTFLVKQAFTSVPEIQLRKTFDRLAQDVAPKIRHYYQTRDPKTGEMIPVLYYFWVKIITTPNGESLPLFSRYVFSQDAYPKKKPKAQIICPECWGLIEDKYDTIDLYCPHCSNRFNPQSGPVVGQYITTKSGHRYLIKDVIASTGKPPEHRQYAMLAMRADGTKLYLPILEEDIALYAETEARLQHESLPLPTLKLRPGHNTNQARSYNYAAWRDFFNARQLLCLGLLLKAILEIEAEVIQEQMLCLFSSTLEYNNLFCTFKGEGTGAVRPLFSNHILKPERTPLENSVWGTDKSSGTFSTLFESRLIPAKRYLDEPFEISFTYDLFGERIGTRKIVASNSISVQFVDSWQELSDSEQGLMILNGNSSLLPLPNACVDAIITDPPYFDFVYYSELSDFFYAWLSPILNSRYPWFSHQDSSSRGEVQHKDPQVFAKQLSSVFRECTRVLKDDGVLVFSFHHSKAEGWAAIYEAISNAGLAVVAAHPVHAEFRAASPKSATKDPISLDAILVCRKRSEIEPIAFEIESILKHSSLLAQKLQNGGIILSTADHFVIVASQTLVALSSTVAEHDSVLNTIHLVNQARFKDILKRT